MPVVAAGRPGQQAAPDEELEEDAVAESIWRRIVAALGQELRGGRARESVVGDPAGLAGQVEGVLIVRRRERVQCVTRIRVQVIALE
jgi:hypothetical protein